MTAATEAPPGTEPIGLGRIAGYGAGDFAFNLFFTFCSLFLLYFYTDVLGLSATTAGLIIMAALIWEGVTDPVMGIIANRTRTRFGRYRPYLLYGAVPLALAYVAMFVPTGLTGQALVLYALLTHLLFRTLYTVVNIPYIALSAQMTRDSLVRGQLAGARMLFAIGCGLTMAAISLPLVKQFGGGNEGFFILTSIYAAAAVVILILCFGVTREVDAGEAQDHPTLGDMFAAMRTNTPFQLLLGATILGAIGSTMSGKVLLYYMKYYAGSESAMTTGLTVSLLAAALAMVPWIYVTKRTSKRIVWLSGTAISASSALAIFLIAPKVGATLWALLALGGIGNAAFVLTFWSMLPDTVEYGEWKTGTRAEGAIFGFIIFAQKIALGIGTGLIGILLDSIGYVPNVAQAPATLDGILVLMTIVPLSLNLLAGSIIWFYPLDQQTHKRIVSEISGAKSRVALLD
jgi:glycoside/pentoside/hexuronide:cation symporter, GPH family